MGFVRKIKKGDKVYLAEVENRWVDGKCVQKHIRYVGKEASGKTVLSASISNVEIEQVKLFGPLLVLDHLAREVGLHERLGEYAKEILSLVYAHCIDYKSINQMERWFERSDLNILLGIEGVTEKRLLTALDSLESFDAETLQRDIFRAVKQQYNLRPSGVVYDVTNTYLYGSKCPQAKLGHDKEGVKGRPLIQIGLGVTKREGIPMFHKVFNGNVHDARTFHDLITALRSFKVKKGLVIYDRGITSKNNLLDLDKSGWDTLCGLPIKGGLKETLRPLIAEKKFIRLDNRVRLNKTVFYVTMRPHLVGDTKGYLVVCFNEQQQRHLRETRYDQLTEAQDLLKKRKDIKPKLKKFFDNDGRLIQRRVREAEEFDGYSCIFSTKRLPAQELVRLYFDKDIVEKAFRILKSILRLRPIRHWLHNRVSAHVFICYLSYLLLSLLKYRLRNVGVSAEEALLELDTMYKVYLRDPKKGFRLTRVVTLSKSQKTILRAIGPKLLKV